jgi:hypothetical protein
MDFIRLDPRRHTKPKALKVGWRAMRVYEALVDISAMYDLRGVLPADYADPAFIAGAVALRPEDWGLDNMEYLTASIGLSLDKLVSSGMLSVEAGCLVVVGWEEFYGFRKAGTERVPKSKPTENAKSFLGEEKLFESTPHHTTTPTTDKGSFRGKDLASLWNAWAAKHKVPQVTKVGGKRAQLADARARENGPEYWTEVLERMGKSPGLLGKNDRQWTVTFDWLLRPMSAAMVLEGKYDRWGKATGESANVLSESEADSLYGEA